jgi:hypothetical protein
MFNRREKEKQRLTAEERRTQRFFAEHIEFEMNKRQAIYLKKTN